MNNCEHQVLVLFPTKGFMGVFEGQSPCISFSPAHTFCLLKKSLNCPQDQMGYLQVALAAVASQLASCIHQCKNNKKNNSLKHQVHFHQVVEQHELKRLNV